MQTRQHSGNQLFASGTGVELKVAKWIHLMLRFPMNLIGINEFVVQTHAMGFDLNGESETVFFLK